MKILITGACGLVARSLIKELEKNHELRLMDLVLPEKATVFDAGNRIKSAFKTDWQFIQGDIMDNDTVRKAVENMDVVVHLAASVTGLPEYGVKTMELNVVGTYHVLDEAKKAGVKRFFCASSINAFGTFYWRLSGKPVDFPFLPLDETFNPVVEDPYSLSKLVNEYTCAAYHRAYGITATAFRFAAIWPDINYRRFLESCPGPTEGWSDDLYQWVHLEDVVKGIRQAIEKDDLPGYGVYTLGAADTRCPELTMEILEKFKPGLVKVLKKPLEGREPLLSIDKAREAFGYDPQFRII